MYNINYKYAHVFIIVCNGAIFIKTSNLKGRLYAAVFKLDQALLISPQTVLVQLIII